MSASDYGEKPVRTYYEDDPRAYTGEACKLLPHPDKDPRFFVSALPWSAVEQPAVASLEAAAARRMAERDGIGESVSDNCVDEEWRALEENEN